VEEAVANAQMDIPDAMIDTEVRQMANDFAQRLQQQGLTMDQYFQFTGMTAEKMTEEIQKMAESYKMEAEKLKEFMGENEKKQMKLDMAVQEAVTFLVENAVEE